jgi:hypothetical protein
MTSSATPQTLTEVGTHAARTKDGEKIEKTQITTTNKYIRNKVEWIFPSKTILDNPSAFLWSYFPLILGDTVLVNCNILTHLTVNRENFSRKPVAKGLCSPVYLRFMLFIVSINQTPQLSYI